MKRSNLSLVLSILLGLLFLFTNCSKDEELETSTDSTSAQTTSSTDDNSSDQSDDNSTDNNDSDNSFAYQDPDCFGEPGFPSTATKYVDMIKGDLGIPPKVILDSLVEIPLYRNGVQVYGEFSAADIDNPSFLGGKGTWSGSAIQRYEGVAEDGSAMTDVVWIAFLRNIVYSGTNYGSVQMIGYNQTTGATAFFESPEFIGEEGNVSSNMTGINDTTLKVSGALPAYGETNFDITFIPPPTHLGAPQCVSCHQADPFITNDFITAAKIPGTNESVIPQLGANAPYYVIGGEDWDMRTIDIEGNQCMACHRVGMGTIELFESAGYDVNTHMPPHNPGAMAADYAQIVKAWRDGLSSVDGARWIVPPTCEDNDGQNLEVGDDYPHKADFNP